MDKVIFELGVPVDQVDSNQGEAAELSDLELACIGGGIGDTIL